MKPFSNREVSLLQKEWFEKFNTHKWEELVLYGCSQTVVGSLVLINVPAYSGGLLIFKGHFTCMLSHQVIEETPFSVTQFMTEFYM